MNEDHHRPGVHCDHRFDELLLHTGQVQIYPIPCLTLTSLQGIAAAGTLSPQQRPRFHRYNLDVARVGGVQRGRGGGR